MIRSLSNGPRSARHAIALAVAAGALVVTAMIAGTSADGSGRCTRGLSPGATTSQLRDAITCLEGNLGATGLSDAVVAFDRYACPPGWVEFRRTTGRLKKESRMSARSRERRSPISTVGTPGAPLGPAAAFDAAYPLGGDGINPAPPILAAAGPKKERFGLLYCRKL